MVELSPVFSQYKKEHDTLMKWLDEAEHRLSGLQGVEGEQKLQVNETFFVFLRANRVNARYRALDISILGFYGCSFDTFVERSVFIMTTFIFN